jgi:asparagine synthase (glutamine-hydrolysing)
MCGIAGIVAMRRSGDDGARRVALMNLAQQHRGPDSSGVAKVPTCDAVFGHTRLSIIDLTETGAQPMSTPDGGVTISFNGEVYNFQQLRRELESQGYSFRGRSDTEVVLNAYHLWGTDSFRRLNGMFAFSIADKRTRCVHLVRDRLGIKPLHYADVESGFIFASEIKGLFASGLVSSAVRPGALNEYMYYGNSLGADTLYEGIRRLPAGSYLTFEIAAGQMRVERFWAPDPLGFRTESFPQAVERVRELLDKAVEHHLI